MLLSGFGAALQAEEVKVDFRDEKIDLEKHFFFSPNKAKVDPFMHLEKEGLRIAWPADQTPRDAIGLSWSYRNFNGDFEAAVHFEILKAEGSLYGTGVELYLQLNNPTGDGLPFSRLSRGKEDDQVWLAQMRTGPNSQRQTEGWRIAKAGAKRGWCACRRNRQAM